ncbi:hypothetical protein [Dysgonomonas capnocytophagoides]|uniref:hypothetical protein n=1 Tax=Dysgonomonas capnocytophagoides TaxID=45254 RepID=UPI000416A865|nr:hypothetical protein [Dysgonomonas capnocytophagoides]
MRQIKFRGKCQRGYDYSDGDGWIYGSLLQKDKVYAIVKTEDIDLSPNTDDGYSFVEDFERIVRGDRFVPKQPDMPKEYEEYLGA